MDFLQQTIDAALTQRMLIVGLGIMLTIIFVVVVIWLTMARVKKVKYLNQIEKLESEKLRIINLDVDPALSRLRKLETEQTQANFTHWREEWQLMKHDLKSQIATFVSETEEALKKRHYQEADRAMLEAQQLLVTEEQSIDALIIKINKFIENVEQYRERVIELKNFSLQLKKTYAANGTLLMKYEEKLQELFTQANEAEQGMNQAVQGSDLDEIEKAFSQFSVVLMNTHDVLVQLPKQHVVYQNMITRIEEVRVLQQKLEKQGYTLQGLQLEEKYERFEIEMQQIGQLLRDFALGEVEPLLKKLKAEVNQTFTVLTKEQRAREKVEKQIVSLRDSLRDVYKYYDKVQTNWQQIASRYQLLEEEVAQFTELQQQVPNLEADYLLIDTKLTEKQSAYVYLLNDIEKLLTATQTIYEQLLAVQTYVDATKKDENHAQNELEQLQKIIHLARRRLAKTRIPIVTANYNQKMHEALDAIDLVQTLLQNELVDIEQLNEALETAQHLTAKLYKETSVIVKTVHLTEKGIVYANRYRGLSPKIDNDLIQSEMYFTSGQYTASLEIVLNVLEAVEPGTYRKLVELYEKKLHSDDEQTTLV
ncbi:MAG: septation ring formation regulator EzrA [Culicoidibacterales bacterium]